MGDYSTTEPVPPFLPVPGKQRVQYICGLSLSKNHWSFWICKKYCIILIIGFINLEKCWYFTANDLWLVLFQWSPTSPVFRDTEICQYCLFSNSVILIHSCQSIKIWLSLLLLLSYSHCVWALYHDICNTWLFDRWFSHWSSFAVGIVLTQFHSSRINFLWMKNTSQKPRRDAVNRAP